MKIMSRGLGRRELIMDFRNYELRREGDELVVAGTITEPVTWDFSIRMEPSDIPGLLRVGFSSKTFGLGFRWAKRLVLPGTKASVISADGPPVAPIARPARAAAARAALAGTAHPRPARLEPVPSLPEEQPAPGPDRAAPAPSARPPARTAAAVASSVGRRKPMRTAAPSLRSRTMPPGRRS